MLHFCTRLLSSFRDIILDDPYPPVTFKLLTSSPASEHPSFLYASMVELESSVVGLFDSVFCSSPDLSDHGWYVAFPC